MEPSEVKEKVRAGYGEIAKQGGACGSSKASCCGPGSVSANELASHVGYSQGELDAIPEGANLGLSCGNPNALAALKAGEVVVDLGSGAGFDAFIAGPKVGATGRVIGVDMTPDMLGNARKNISTYRQRTGLDNVEFRLGEIEHLPVADATVDVLISNCVINLSPDKPRVWQEMSRVLKPGGRVAVSDLALLRPLPAAVAEMVEALVGCVAGAVLISETEEMARQAGFSEIKLVPKPDYVNGMADWQDPLYQKILASLPPGEKPSDYIVSLEITATKPINPKSMKTNKLEIYDPAMCCSTGVCGPSVDPKLVQFAADVKWLESQGVTVARYNLSQNPAAFVENPKVNSLLNEKGESILPLILLGETVISSGKYPSRCELKSALGLDSEANSLISPAVVELIAMGAAIAANCEPCLKYHYSQAQKLGVSKRDMVAAVSIAAMVKDSPHQAVLRLADRLTGASLSAPVQEPDACCGGNSEGSSCCCGD